MNPHSWPDPPGQMAFPVARAGYPPIFGAAFVTLIFALLGMTYLTALLERPIERYQIIILPVMVMLLLSSGTALAGCFRAAPVSRRRSPEASD